MFIKPIRTSYSGREEKQTLSTKLGSTSGVAAGLNAGLNPVGTILFTKSKTNEKAASSEKTLQINRIDHYDNYGKIWWSFNIDDVNFRESGMIMREDDLPIVHFKFRHWRL